MANKTIVKINDCCKKIQFLNGAQLKLIAIVSMLIDHINKSMIYPNLVTNDGFLTKLSNLFDIIGRIAFPLFCFLLVEGFYKTHSRKKYLLNLIIFGVISEVPFDMFTTASFFNKNWNNVMFSLALVLVTIWIIDTLKEKMKDKRFPYTGRILCDLLIDWLCYGILWNDIVKRGRKMICRKRRFLW